MDMPLDAGDAIVSNSFVHHILITHHGRNTHHVLIAHHSLKTHHDWDGYAFGCVMR